MAIEQEYNRIFSNNLKHYLNNMDMTQAELALRLGVSAQSVSNWCSGAKSPRMDKVDSMCRIFNCRRSDLMEEHTQPSLPPYDNIVPIQKQKIHVLGEVAAGKPIFMNEEREVYVNTPIKADFALIARGDSMIGARINDGDLVFIRQQSIVDNGEIAVVAIDDEATLKRFYYYKEKALMILKAENPKYEDLIYSGEELDHVHVLGKAVAFQSDLN